MGAEVKLYKDVYDYGARMYKRQTMATLKTDAMGLVSYAYSSEQYLNLSFTVRYGDDFMANPNTISLYKNRYQTTRLRAHLLFYGPRHLPSGTNGVFQRHKNSYRTVKKTIW